MPILESTLEFVTPAFLGNAEQNGQWRTPPIKAQLRQWWRVAYAAEKHFAVSVKEMRHEEGRLFGHAWLEDDHNAHGEKISARKSQVRIRLSRWDQGKMSGEWPRDISVQHPEVEKNHGAVGSALYLGYGPLKFDSGRTALKAHAAIQAGESAGFSLAVPEAHRERIEQALWLMDHYGTLGGRSRNGWGSFRLTHDASSFVWNVQPVLRDWEQALQLDWPHAIGKDAQGALIWQTVEHEDWNSLMRTLAETKIGLRTQFRFTTCKNAPAPEQRHWLSYPVTHHSVSSWGNNARLPNQLRFKVRQNPDGKLVGTIFSVPHCPPATFKPDRKVLQEVWKQVHTFLDKQTQLTRIPE